MSIKMQCRTRIRNHKQMYGKPFFGMFRCNKPYIHRHLTDNKHWLINTKLYGTRFVYGASQLDKKEQFLKGGYQL